MLWTGLEARDGQRHEDHLLLELGVGLRQCEHRFGDFTRVSGPVSSRRGPQTARKCSYRSDVAIG